MAKAQIVIGANGGNGGAFGTFTAIQSTAVPCNCGFNPTHIWMYRYSATSSNVIVNHFDFSTNKLYQTSLAQGGTVSATETEITDSTLYNSWWATIARSSSGFSYTAQNANNAVKWGYVAI